MFTELPDLAAERLGGAVLACNDEFFAPKERLILPAAPVWREGEYTEHGKWMDGWETRRRRTPGFDWAILRLGIPGVIRGIVIDTSFFTGNYPEHASLDACELPSGTLGLPSPRAWKPLVPRTALKGNTPNSIAVKAKPKRVTHVRLNIFPDGGVARLRIHGEPQLPPGALVAGRELDLAALENGGMAVDASDRHYGQPNNLLLPGRSTHMGDGWETRRRRGPGHDWCIIRLARRGTIERIELDTDHYKGNAPGKAMLESADAGGASLDRASWRTLLKPAPLEPHARHQWVVSKPGPATHVRLNIYPDGGVARLRLFGRLAE